MRLIDADALKEKLLKERDAIPKTITERYGFGVETPNRNGNFMRGGIRKALRCMEQTPTIDAVPVVRCKDCKHQCTWYEEEDFGVFICGVSGLSIVEDNDFCSYGERKTDE